MHKRSIQSPWNLFISHENLSKLLAGNENKESHFICCRQNVTKNNLLEHIQKHSVPCNLCKQFESDELIKMLTHLREIHKIDDFPTVLKEFQEMVVKKIRQSYFVYKNGLVLRYQSLHGTQYDPIPSIDQAIEDWIGNLKKEFMQVLRNEYVFKVITPYVYGEDIKMIFLNLRERLGIEIHGGKSEFVKIDRSSSKRSIVVECRTAETKNMFKKKSKRTVFATELMSSGYNLPIDCNIPIKFEF